MTNKAITTNLAKAILVILAVIMTSLEIFPASAEEIKRLYFEDVGVSIEMPESVRYVTQAVDNSGNYFSEGFGNDPDNKLIQSAREAVKQLMISRNIYIRGLLDNDGRSSFDIIIKKSEHAKDFSKLEEDSEKEAMLDYWKEVASYSGIQVNECTWYEGERYKAIRFLTEEQQENRYHSIYLLIENGMLIETRATYRQPEIREDTEPVIREIFDSIRVQ